IEEAFGYEREAAQQIPASSDTEPSRSVLHRSAAALALQCGDLREAERLACAALAGFPPMEIAVELRLLIDEVKYRRNWADAGLELAANEMELRLDGPAIGPGVTPASALVEKIETARVLFTRTAERLQGMAFRKRGRPKGGIAKDMQFFMSYAAAGSFGVTLQLGSIRDQLHLEGTTTLDGVIEDTLSCLQAFTDGDTEGIERLIQDETYRRNFMALAHDLEPDGKELDVVALASQSAGVVRRVTLRHCSATAREKTTAESQKDGWVQLTGELVSAEKSTQPGRQGSFHIVDAAGRKYPVVVLDGMSDVVRKHWDDPVTISGKWRKRAVVLERIVRASGDNAGPSAQLGDDI
ncbi:MAG: hypothetical protein WCP21_13015, partial [Armatimonadota bacterium]